MGRSFRVEKKAAAGRNDLGLAGQGPSISTVGHPTSIPATDARTYPPASAATPQSTARAPWASVACLVRDQREERW